MYFRLSREAAVVICLFSVLFMGTADNQVLSPLLPAIRTQLARSSREMGYLFTAYSLSAGISVLLWGPVSDQFGRKRSLLAGLIIFAIGSAVSLTAATFGRLLAGRAVTGLGASMLSLNALSYAADFFPYQARGWAMGSIVSSYFAALILGVPIGSWIGERLGWHSVFGLASITGVCLVILAAVFLPPLSQRRGSPLAAGIFSRAVGVYFSFLRTEGTLGAIVCAFFASAGTMGFLAFLGVWLHDAFGIPSGKIGLIFLVSGAAAFVASPLAGSLSDRIGKSQQFVASNIMLALLLVALPSLRWGYLLFLLFFAISLTAAFRQGPMEALLSEIVPSQTRGAFLALKNSFSQLGIGTMSVAAGVLYQGSGYRSICLLCAFSNLAAALAVVWIGRRRNL